FFLLSYTWSKSIDVSSGYFGVENGPGGGAVVQNYFDLKSNQGVSAFDITHFLSLASVYELPFGHEKKWLRSRPLSWILGDWQANPLFPSRARACRRPYFPNFVQPLCLPGADPLVRQSGAHYSPWLVRVQHGLFHDQEHSSPQRGHETADGL